MRSAIIGTGCIAPVHLEAILEAGGEIIALCDIEPKKAEKLNKEFNLQAKIYTDYRKMYQEEALDIVHICTPHYLHLEMTIAALEENINVLAEKPLGIHIEDLKKLKEIVQSTQAKLGVALQNRYLPVNQFAYNFLQGEEIINVSGKVVWNRDAAYYKAAPWRGKWSTAGGGAMINQAIHTLDLIIWFCGMPKAIKGSIKNDNLQDLIEVETSAKFQMFGDYNAEFYGTTTSHNNYPIELSIETKNHFIKIIGKDIYIDDCLQELPDPGQVRWKSYWGAGHQYLIKDFYDSVRENKHFPVGFEEAEKSLKVILALYRSRGEVILIDKE